MFIYNFDGTVDFVSDHSTNELAVISSAFMSRELEKRGWPEVHIINGKAFDFLVIDKERNCAFVVFAHVFFNLDEDIRCFCDMDKHRAEAFKMIGEPGIELYPMILIYKYYKDTGFKVSLYRWTEEDESANPYR